MNAHGGQEHQLARLSLGAYVLGGLGPAERAEVEHHLATCPACRGELAGLAVVPGLLGRIEWPGPATAPGTSTGANTGTARGSQTRPDPTTLPRLLGQVRAERARRGKQTRRLRLTAALTGVAAAAAVAVTIAPAVTDRSEPAGPVSPAADIVMTPAGPGPSAGRASLEDRVWGTAVSLELQRLPAGTSFVAWAVADDGRREQAATWGATPTGAARLSGATAIPRAQLVRLEVATTTGVPVLTAAG